MKAHIGGAYTMSGGAASAIALSTEDEGFRALEYRFAVPVDAIVGTSSPPAPAPDAGRGAEPAGVSGEEKQKSTHRGSAENTSRAVVSSPLFPEVQVAALFEAYKALVTGGGGSMAIQLLINLFVRFIEAVSLIDVEDCTSPAIDAYAISVATLRCWQGLLSNHHGSRSDLLSRLNATERLVLLECALGVIRSFKSPPADQEVAAAGCDVVEGALAAVASDLAVSLLQHVLAPTEAVPESAPFWLASCGNVQVQARTIWAVVIAHRLFPDASCGSAGSSRLLHLLTSLKQFLLTEGAPSRPMKLHLPHVSHSPSKFIDAQACDRLLNSFKYEAEVQSLVDSFAPTTAWVSSALLQVRARKSLSDFLQAADDQKTTLDIVDTAGSTALASRTVPQLLLDACGVLGSWAQWCEVMNALLQAMDTEVSELFAAKKLTSSSAVSEEFAWVAPFLEKVTTCLSAAKLSASSTSIANSDNVHLKSVQHHLAVMVYVFGTRSRHCTVASEICTRCCKLFSALSEAALLADAEGGARSNSSPADVVCPAFTHVSIAVALRLSVDHLHRCSPPAVTGSQEKIPSVLMDMWRFLSEALGRDSVVLSSIPPQAAEYLLLIVCALWERHCAEMPPQLHIALVSVLAQVAVALPALPPPAKASILSHCHWEVLDQSLHLADLSSRSSRRRRRSRTSTSGSSQPCAPISLLMMSLVEDLVYSASFEREFTQREQRGLCFVLGQLYHLLYGLPMVPLESGDSSADEGPAASPTFLTATDGTNSAALVKLYRYTQLCIRGGWVGKAEIRLSLHFLSRAKLFELVPVSPPVLRVFRRIFTLLEDETGVEDSATVEDPAVSTVCGDVALVQGVGQELFHLLLQQGLPASDLLANSSSGGDDADSADGWGDEYTSLNAACDLGPFFLDHKQGITLQLCLKDLNYNPHRASSWHLLLMVLMEAYNALVDELQKLLLLDHLPEACHQFVVPQYRSLFFQGEQASTSALSVWKPTAPVRALVVDQLMASAVAELESACGEPVIAVLGPTFALETHSNGLRSGSAAGSTEDAFCAKVANLLALKNTAFDVLDRAWNVMQSAAGHATDVVDDDADDDHQRSKQTRAETYHLVMRNAVKCYPKSSLQGRRFKFAALKAISTGEHKYILIIFFCSDFVTCCRLLFQTTASTTTYSLCLRAQSLVGKLTPPLKTQWEFETNPTEL